MYWPFRSLLESFAMLRPKDYSRWKTRVHYDSIDEFLNPTQPVVHTVSHRGVDIDFLVHDRGADTTLVVFHASLSIRAKTLPQLQGAGLARDTGCNLIAVSDPTLTEKDLELGWYLGNKETGPLPPVLAPLILAAIKRLNSSRTILIGPSGGGYAAILYGQYFPDSIVLAINPRLDLGAKPSAGWKQYVDEAHQAHTNPSRVRVRKNYAVERLRELFADIGLPFDLCLYQNSQDRSYVQNQTQPFLKRLGNDERLFVRMEDDGSGHRPIPSAKLREIIKSLSTDSDQQTAIRLAGFNHPN